MDWVQHDVFTVASNPSSGGVLDFYELPEPVNAESCKLMTSKRFTERIAKVVGNQTFKAVLAVMEDGWAAHLLPFVTFRSFTCLFLIQVLPKPGPSKSTPITSSRM